MEVAIDHAPVVETEEASGGIIGRRVAVSTIDRAVTSSDIAEGRIPSFMVTAAVGTVTRKIEGTDAYAMQVLGSNNEKTFPYLQTRTFKEDSQIQLRFLARRRSSVKIGIARRFGLISQRTADLARSGIQIETKEIDPKNPVGRILVTVDSRRRDR